MSVPAPALLAQSDHAVDQGGTQEPFSERSARRRPRERPHAAALAVAVALACSPLAFGYYDLTSWAPLGLGAGALLVTLALAGQIRLDAPAVAATAGIALLALLSFASILWAESRESAWTSANLLAVYAMVFIVGLIAIRTRVTAWAVMVLLGLPALVTAIVLAGEFVIGSGAGAFLEGRLNAPIGYANGTAALLVMGCWPWIGLAERSESRWWRAAAISAATLTAGAALLTQTRAIVLAAAASIALTLVTGPGRARRAANLAILLVGVAAAGRWILRVYGSTGPTHLPAPGPATLREAGLALLGAAGLAFLLAFLADRRSGVARPRRVDRRLGVLMLAAIALMLTAGIALERRSIVAQWHDFTTLNDERSANNRFLAPGGGPRYDLWRIATREFAGDPLGGVGAGNYPDQEFRLRRGLEHVSTPHSLELQMLAELGVGGAVGLLLLVGPVLVAGISGRSGSATGVSARNRSAERLTGHDAALRTAALGTFTAWLAGTSVDWLYNIPGLTGMAMLAAAALLAPAGSAAVPAGGRPRALAAITVSMVAVVAASLGRQYVATLYGDSAKAQMQAHPLRALQELRASAALDPWSLQTEYEVAAIHARMDDYPGARAALQRAARLEPENFVPPALLGDIALRAGYDGVALAEYRRASRLDPLDASLRGMIGEIRSSGALQSVRWSRSNSASKWRSAAAS